MKTHKAAQSRPAGSDPSGRRCRQDSSGSQPLSTQPSSGVLAGMRVNLGPHSWRILATALLHRNKQADDFFQALGYLPHKQEFCHRQFSSVYTEVKELDATWLHEETGHQACCHYHAGHHAKPVHSRNASFSTHRNSFLSTNKASHDRVKRAFAT